MLRRVQTVLTPDIVFGGQKSDDWSSFFFFLLAADIKASN